jgi:hypothetical protein
MGTSEQSACCQYLPQPLAVATHCEQHRATQPLRIQAVVAAAAVISWRCFTPTSSSWLNLVEWWFHLLTERRLRRGTFNSVDQLVDAIEVLVDHWNNDPRPFTWKYPADEILARVRRGGAALTNQINSATDH